MGMEINPLVDRVPLEKRPGIFVIGSSNVGKRTLLSRLLSVDLSEASDSPSEVLCHGWTIDTKYYTADVSVWMAHLVDGFSFGSLPISNQVAALVMVFDMNDLSSFSALQHWTSSINIQKFEILLCIGNKADLLPGHSAHAEYRRRLQKRGESSSDPHPEYLDYGIFENEGSSLLGDEESSSGESRRACMEWCSQYNIEYIEACASNADFDKCLSVDGDSQGVDRLCGALSAHMWPGMVLKTGNKISQSPLGEKEDLSDGESDYEIEYEILSRGSAEPINDLDESWVALNDLSAAGDSGKGSSHIPATTASGEGSSNLPANTDSQERSYDPPAATEVREESANGNILSQDQEDVSDGSANGNIQSVNQDAVGDGSTKGSILSEDRDKNQITSYDAGKDHPSSLQVPLQEESQGKIAELTALDKDVHVGYEDLEQLMCEISHIRENLRLMPDVQRKEMAAKVAMKMAFMFADSDEEGFD